ncbi:MAG: hypothetical protein Q9216_004668 [Gyalolechia sp. 2 TL-2023]
MAWVRPKNPKPKPKADPVDTLVPMLSYFSNRRVTSRPASPTKPNVAIVPISHDPILRSLQQAQQLQAQVPITDEEEDAVEAESDHQSRKQHSHYPKVERRQERSTQPSQRIVTHRPREPSLPPPPPRIVRQQPRVSSYERYRPVERPQERYVPRHVPYPTYGEHAPARAVSARWASATTPLDLR